MSSAANQDAYGNPAWGPGAGYWNRQEARGPWGPGGDERGWYPPPFWGRGPLQGPMGVALMVLGFIFFWPVGLAILIYLLGSGRMGFNGRRRRGAYQSDNFSTAGWGGWKGWACGGGGRAAPSSGNRAFDEYRTETLRRLEEEQKEFGAFLDRLRFARDKAEFDQFMAERRGRPTTPNGNTEQPAT
jgi:hypothetical protein